MSFLGGLGAEQRDVYARSSNPPSPFLHEEIIFSYTEKFKTINYEPILSSLQGVPSWVLLGYVLFKNFLINQGRHHPKEKSKHLLKFSIQVFRSIVKSYIL